MPQREDEPRRPDLSRRRVVQALGAMAAVAGVPPAGAAVKGQGRYGLAYTSFAVRMRQGRDLIRGAAPGARAFPAETFIDLCRRFGADGAQMDLTQLASEEPAYLDGLRAKIAETGLFLELSVDSKIFEDEARFDVVAGVARRVGASRFRVALLHGRRYEDFKTADDWRAFASRWTSALPKAKAWLERHRIPVGIENHKDFRTAEMVELLRSVDSPYLGVCLDFGNNVSFLEDPLEMTEALAPFAVTTHLKDMAVRPYEDGFELSEVPLGQGFLPLARIVETIRKHRPEAPLVLEMITRDPLKVPYRKDAYWTTFGGRNPALVERFEATALARAWKEPLPRVSGLNLEQMIAAEDENVRLCTAYTRATLGA